MFTEVMRTKKILQIEWKPLFVHKYEKKKSLEEHSADIVTKKERNFTIVEAIEDGYKQVEITEFLSISSLAIFKIIAESGNSWHVPYFSLPFYLDLCLLSLF